MFGDGCVLVFEFVDDELMLSLSSVVGSSVGGGVVVSSSASAGSFTSGVRSSSLELDAGRLVTS